MEFSTQKINIQNQHIMKKNYSLFVAILLLSLSAIGQNPGTLNPEFSTNGWDASVYGNNNGFYINKSLIQPDGKILVCGEGYYSSEATQAVVTRYNIDGSFDTTFGGGDGTVRSKDDAAIDLWTHASGMGLQSTGKIIIAGDVFYNEERIFRLNADGSLDASFGIDGVISRPRPNAEYIYHVGIQSDNKIIVCGEEKRFVNGVLVKHIFLWRYTENGILDTTFGNSGDVSYNISNWLDGNEILLLINDLIVLPDDKIIINQSYSAASSSFVMLKKLNANGTVDTSFGTNGEAIKAEVSNDGNYKYSSSSVQQNGSIITSFSTRDAVNSNYTESLFRINAQGIVDPLFNINLGNPTNYPTESQVKVSGDKVYFIKKAGQSGYDFDEIHCYDLNGNLVTSFGENGIAIIDQNDIPQSYPNKAAISPDGNIYLISNTNDPNNPDNTMFLAINVTGFNANLSVVDNEFENQIVVNPNPTTGLVSISNSENTTIDKVEMTDSLGKIIFTETENTSQIDLSNFSPGIYILKIYSEQSVSQKKMIKL